MATGRMRFYSLSLSGQTNITYVLPNDVPPMMTMGNPCFQRPTKALYLLHGISGNDCDWEFTGNAEDLSMRFNLAFFMITCGNDFYLDREATGRQYCQFAGKEVIDYTRKTFGLSERAEDTIIGGLSMGGFGALHTALAYPDTFGAVIALSSALVIHNIAGMKPGAFDGIANEAYYREVFGDLDKVAESDNNPEVLYDRLAVAGAHIPPIYMAVGTEDFLYGANQEFRRFLEKRHADLRYEEGPGVHNWDFWNPYMIKGVEWALGRLE